MQIERIASLIRRESAWTPATSVEAISDALRENNQEWKDKDQTKFKKLVLEAMKIVFPHAQQSPAADSGSSSKVMSLNQTVFHLGHQNNPSKRHKPESSETSSTNATASSSSSSSSSSESGNGAPTATGNDAESNNTSGLTNTAQGGGGEKKKAKRKAEAMSNETNLNIVRPTSGSFLVPKPQLRLSDLAGVDAILEQVRELVFYPVQYPELYAKLGIHPPCGLLLRGPSGCGKTALACAIAGELGLPFFKASGPELVGGASGESESRIRDVFAAASAASPSILFLDGIDVIAAKHDANQRGMDRRIIVQLLDCIDSISGSSGTLQKSSDGGEKSGSGSGLTEAILSTSAIPEPTVLDEKDKETKEKDKEKPKGMVILLAATNKPDSLDSSVRGRFSKELSLPVPDAPSRTKIIQIMSKEMRLSEDVQLDELGRMTPGFVGADLKALVREAGMFAVSRILGEAKSDQQALTVTGTETTEDRSSLTDGMAVDEADPVARSQSVEGLRPLFFDDSTLFVRMDDFLRASKTVMPSAKREGFAVVPDVTWNDVGALSEVREELLHNVLEPIAHPDWYRSLGLEVPAGVLFFGPPGCGKTLLAKAVANQSGANFISVKGPELLNMFVGESESRVRQVFSRARASAPCVIFFDELDALCPRRGSGGDGGGNGVSERVVNQLLTELDGLETRKDVYIIAATNRLELIDDAMLRPGRLGKLLYVPLPTPSDRVSILAALTRTTNIDFDADSPTRVDVDGIGRDERTNGFSGADLAALVREAGLAVVREWREVRMAAAAGDNGSSSSSSSGGGKSNDSAPETAVVWDSPCIRARHFEAAFGRVKPSVAAADRERYEKVHHLMKNEGMSAIQALNTAARK